MAILSCTGSDGVGKTTLVNVLSEVTGYPSKHFDKPKDMEDGKQQYFGFLENLDSDKTMICDRFHEGEWIYAPLYRGYTADYLREFEKAVIHKHAYLQVYVKAELETIIERTRRRGEDFVKEEDFQTALDLFDDFMNQQTMPYIEIDTTNSKTEEDVKKVIEAFERTKFIWELTRRGDECPGAVITPVQPRGNINGDVMVITQNPGGRGKCEYSTVWSGGPNYNFFMDVIKKAGIYRDTWFTNLVPYPTENNQITDEQIEATEHILYAQVEAIKPKVLVTLGKSVTENVKKTYGGDLPIIEAFHPSYVKRFQSGDKSNHQLYIDSIAKAKEYLGDK